MTSKISTSKSNDFLSLLKWTLSQNFPIILIYSIFLFICSTLVNIWTIASSDTFFHYLVGANFHNIQDTIFSFTYVIPTIIATVFTPIICLRVFKYMQKKRTVDFFGSLPVSRMTMFKSRFAAGAIMVTAPLFLCQTLNLILTVLININPEIFLIMLSVLILSLLCAFAGYSICAFMFTCCGSEISSIISYIALSGVFPMSMFFIEALFTSWVPGFSDSIYFSSILFSLFTPSIAPLILFSQYDFVQSLNEKFIINLSSEFILHIVIIILLAIAFTLFSYKIMKTRKMEAAQSGLNFKAPIYVIRFLSCFAGGFFLSEIFMSFGSKGNYIASAIYFNLIFILTSFAIHLCFELICFKTLKGLVKSLKYYIFVVAFMILLFIYTTSGFFGQDIYVPATTEVDNIVMEIKGYNYDRTYTFKDSKNIKLISDMHNSITSKIRDIYDYPYIGYSEISSEYMIEYDKNEYWLNYYFYDIKLTYNLNNGKQVVRNYTPELIMNENFPKYKDYFIEFHEINYNSEY